MITPQDILLHLRVSHAGQDKAVSAARLSERFGVRERGIRR